jgi:hypothetical protein
MGFNKRFVDEKIIRDCISNDRPLKNLFNADALIFMDSFASEVYKLHEKGMSEDEIKSKINELNGQENSKTTVI